MAAPAGRWTAVTVPNPPASVKATAGDRHDPHLRTMRASTERLFRWCGGVVWAVLGALGTLRVASGEVALGVGMFFCVLNGMATGILSTARCCRFATDPVRRLLQIVYLIKTTGYLAS